MELAKYNQKDSRLAGLCYFPVLNFFLPIYVFISNKKGKYVRFHAMQAFLCFWVFFLAWTILQFLFVIPLWDGYIAFFSIDPYVYVNMAMGGTTQAQIDIAAILLLKSIDILFALSFMFLAYTGRKFEIPVLSKIAMKAI